MKAVQFSEYGGPHVLRVADVDEPHAGAGQIRVAVKGAGVNPVDWKIRSGAMQQAMPVDLPSIPGSDVAGVVDEVGDGATDVAVGDEVFGFAVGGGAAQHAVLEHYATKPGGLAWAERATAPAREHAGSTDASASTPADFREHAGSTDASERIASTGPK